MKIGVVVDNELNNDKRVLREIDILKNAGNEICVLCFGFSNKAFKNIEGLKISRIRINRKIKDTMFFLFNLIPFYELFWSVAIKRFIVKYDLEALHVHDLYMSKAGRTGINKSGKRIMMILDLHENYPYAVTTYNWTKGFLRNLISQPGKWQAKEKLYLSIADRIIVLSDEFRDQLTGRYPEFPAWIFATVPNVPDLSQVGSSRPATLKINLKKNAPVVFYFGVVAERRGIFDALHVFCKLALEEHPAVFLIIGPVDRKDTSKFFNLINSEPLKRKVYYIPWIDLSELPGYLEVADICIAPFQKNPQHESGIANKIFDYMLGKKPVIVSDCKPQRALVEKYSCGLVFKNTDEMKAAIIMLSENPGLRKEMGQNGYNAIISEFNTDKIKENLLKIYRS